MRTYLPISIDITNKRILIVGGGNVALRKIEMLEKFTAKITVVASHISPEIMGKGYRCIEKGYERGDIAGHFLVYACTNDRELNSRIKEDAKNLACIVNVVDDPDLCDFLSPAIHRDGFMTIAVSSGGQDVNKSIKWRDLIKRFLEQEMVSELEASDTKNKFGKVYLVGFGPGDKELMTRKAHRILSRVDVIMHDKLIDVSALKDYAAEIICVGKRKDLPSHGQDEINEMMYRYALEGKDVARLKGGDCFIFGRGGEELCYLREHMIKVEIIPGITAAAGAAACSEIPLTQREISSSVAFCTGHPEDKISVPNTDTIVYYMASSSLNSVTDKMRKSGHSPETPIALIRNATMPQQKITVTTLGEVELTNEPCDSPLIVIVGDVVSA
jgi:uroporphyrin-III C-methyltransferase/precorrin-2 dehydrogenase/sirohydrochlorin ferrochelatase